eukprot:15336250-Ditylum_brightwellii.AAC.1
MVRIHFCWAFQTLDTDLADRDKEQEFIEDSAKVASTTINRSLLRGIFKDETCAKEPINPWSCTDSDSNINCFLWSDNNHE